MSIQATEKNVDSIFAGTIYYIDFYQRQYTWSGEPVVRLLDDVFYTFKEGYDKHKDSELPLNDTIRKE
jgi:hypothetical protein